MSAVDAKGPGLTVGAVARRLGIAPATLRTWDRRYGLGPSEHRAGAHRRYSNSDVARLEYMRRLVSSGVGIADAASAAREVVVPDVDHPLGTLTPTPIEGFAPSSVGGGQELDVAASKRPVITAQDILGFAQELDLHGCREAFDFALEERGVVWTWDNLMAPVLVAVGERWSVTSSGIEIEHLASQAVEHALVGFIKTQAPPVAQSVILSCLPEEQHSLPLWALAAALSERRIGSHVLGARVPVRALLDASARLQPAAVLLWSQVSHTADAEAVRQVAAALTGTMILVAGRGWQGAFTALPHDVRTPLDLTDAVTRISRRVSAA